MTCTVFDEFDEILGSVDRFDNLLRNFEVRLLLVAPDVVDLADVALAENDVEGSAVILDVDSLTDVRTITVDGECLAVRGILDELGDDILEMLARPEVIASPRDEDREIVCGLITLCQQVSTRFRRGIGVP